MKWNEMKHVIDENFLYVFFFATFILFFFLALACCCLTAFIPKYLYNFFLKDNSHIIQGKSSTSSTIAIIPQYS